MWKMCPVFAANCQTPKPIDNNCRQLISTQLDNATMWHLCIGLTYGRHTRTRARGDASDGTGTRARMALSLQL